MGTTADWVEFSHAPLHRQSLECKIFLVEPGGGAVDVTGAGGQEHRQPLRRARRVGAVDLHQLACHTGLCHERVDGGAKGGGDADEDERAEAQNVPLRLCVEKRNFSGCVAGRCVSLCPRRSS
eukprot:scaffold91237_cov60-Phaeocystis_antarctica.AAC.1